MYELPGWSKTTFINPFTLIIFIKNGVHNKGSKLQTIGDSSILVVRVKKHEIENFTLAQFYPKMAKLIFATQLSLCNQC